MFLGLDHIALTCVGLEEASAVLNNCLYITKFAQPAIINDPAKTNLLSAYQPTHDIAYLYKPGFLSIELTDHGAAFACPSPSGNYQVLFDSRPQGSSPLPEEQFAEPLAVLKGLDPAGTFLAARLALPLSAPIFYKDLEAKGQGGITKIILACADLEESTKFWTESVGCKVFSTGISTRGTPWTLLSFTSPVATLAFKFVLYKANVPQEPSKLDQTGFPCLALITSSLERDLERLKSCGARAETETFTVRVNQKDLRVCLSRAPGGELVELIQVMPSN